MVGTGQPRLGGSKEKGGSGIFGRIGVDSIGRGNAPGMKTGQD